VRRALCLGILRSWVERDRINVAMLKGRIDESAPPDSSKGLGFPGRPSPEGEAAPISAVTAPIYVGLGALITSSSRRCSCIFKKMA
jgi:hypothetical protein